MCSVRIKYAYIDLDLSMQSYVQQTGAGCFAVLRQLRCIRRSFSSSVYLPLLLRLHYGNALTLHWLVFQSVYSTVSNPSSTLLLGLSLVFVVRPISLTQLPVSIGWKLMSESSSNWRSVYRAYHDTASRCPVAAVPPRTRLGSSTSSRLDVRPARFVSVADRSFATAGLGVWNSLPNNATSASSLPAFRRTLKIHLFQLLDMNIIFVIV